MIKNEELSLTDTENDILDLMHEEWSNNVGFKPKWRYYIKCKLCNLDVTRSQRSLLVQFRMGILPLQIETWMLFKKRIPLTERLYLHCNQNLIEDEYHFLCQYLLHQVERYTLCSYIPNFESLAPNEQFIKLMTYFWLNMLKIAGLRENIFINITLD